MEMGALIWALKNYGGPEHREKGFLVPVVYSDSMYCVNSFTNWIKGWKANGWVRSGNKPLENLDLIKEWDRLCNEGYQIDLRYIKGHSGEIWNEIADKLATGQISPQQVLDNYGIESEMLDYAKDLFGDHFSNAELLSRLESHIKQDIGEEERCQ